MTRKGFRIIDSQKKWLGCVFCIVFILLGCIGVGAEQSNKDFSLVYEHAFDKQAPLFSFVQVTDTHIIAGKSVKSVKKGIEDINLLDPQPEFVVVTGDLIDGARPTESTELYKKLFSTLRCPFFSVFGNHDNREAYKKLLGEFNYSFDLAPYHFIVLDNIVMEATDTYGGKFSKTTIAWLKAHIQSVNKKTPIILFCHAAIYREPSYSKNLPGDAYNYESVLEILESYNVVAWFDGHAHCNYYVRKKEVDYFTTGCLSDNRNNSNCPLGYRIVSVYKDRVETVYRTINDFACRITVAQDGSGDFNGRDEKPILDAIEKAGKSGETTIFIKPGTYLIRKQLYLKKNGITIAGTPQTVLRLPSPVLTITAAEKGQELLQVEDCREFAPDTTVYIYPPAGSETFPDGNKKPLEVVIKSVETRNIHLSSPLACAIPAGSRLGYTNNIFAIYKHWKHITIRDLNIDGGRREDIRMPGHCQRCGLLAHGHFSYADGPKVPPIEDVSVINCHIHNCYGRAVAMYWVVRGEVKGCLIENIDDEAIDFDHFCFYCRAIGNDIRNVSTGITLNDASYCTVEYNRITNCGSGVNMWWWHKSPQKYINIENKIRHNFIYSPELVGISIGRRCFWNKITGNFVEEGSKGSIRVVGPNNVVENNCAAANPVQLP